MSLQPYVLQAVEYERIQQDKQWGGPEHDDSLSYDVWALVLQKHIGRLADKVLGDPDDLYRQTIVLAALAVAFAESQRRRPKRIDTRLAGVGQPWAPR